LPRGAGSFHERSDSGLGIHRIAVGRGNAPYEPFEGLAPVNGGVLVTAEFGFRPPVSEPGDLFVAKQTMHRGSSVVAPQRFRGGPKGSRN
jgi:hypothetical protein